jgi:hypothetical protein
MVAEIPAKADSVVLLLTSSYNFNFYFNVNYIDHCILTRQLISYQLSLAPINCK